VVIDRVILRKMCMPLKQHFETSFGAIENRSFILVEVHSADHIGYAEVTVEAAPLYNEESVSSAWHVLKEYLIPLLFNNMEHINHPSQISPIFKRIRRNNLAKAGLESAVWDLFAKQNGISLATLLKGEKSEIDVGISIGIQDEISKLLDLIEGHKERGYKRIKVKIKPGWDLNVVEEIRKKFPDLPLMVDANSAYSLADIELFKEMDQYNLMMIEQPLAHDDIVDHSALQKEITTPICLDESIHSVEDVRRALYLKSCKIINVKIGRVGGLQEAIQVHDYCQANDIPVWCGGMLEAGVGRAHNIAITTLSNFTLPGDTAASSHYWFEDIIEPEVTVSSTGTIMVPNRQPGIGFSINHHRLNKYTDYSEQFKG
jgi:O-succinylbenzoate synthase